MCRPAWANHAGCALLQSPPLVRRTDARDSVLLLFRFYGSCVPWLYNKGRPHQSLGPGIPDQVEPTLSAVHDPERISSKRRLSSKPILGGLHHEYRWADAA